MDAQKSRSLKTSEITAIKSSPHPENYVIDGIIDYGREMITLLRGDMSMLVLPFEYFKPNAVVSPDFSKFAVIDGGMGLRFGEYEASVHTILYEKDASYRRIIDGRPRKKV